MHLGAIAIFARGRVNKVFEIIRICLKLSLDYLKNSTLALLLCVLYFIIFKYHPKILPYHPMQYSTKLLPFQQIWLEWLQETNLTSL